MSLTVKLIVSLVIAAAVAAAATFLQGGQFPDLPMLVACCVAALVSVLVVSLLDRPHEDAPGAVSAKPSVVSSGQANADRDKRGSDVIQHGHATQLAQSRSITDMQ